MARVLNYESPRSLTQRLRTCWLKFLLAYLAAALLLIAGLIAWRYQR